MPGSARTHAISIKPRMKNGGIVQNAGSSICVDGYLEVCVIQALEGFLQRVVRIAFRNDTECWCPRFNVRQVMNRAKPIARHVRAACKSIGRNRVVMEIHRPNAGIFWRFPKIEFAEPHMLFSTEYMGHNRERTTMLGIGIKLRIIEQGLRKD